MADYMLMEKLRKHHAGTYYHSLRVSQLAFHIASRAGMEMGMCLSASRAGLLHDIGKIYVSSQILSKRGPLTEDEYRTVKDHVENGAAILKLHDYEESIVRALYGHHEREDGSGYPNGTTTNSELARIIAVCDVFDAMTEQRDYKPAIAKSIVLSHMHDGYWGAFKISYVEILHEVVHSKFAGQNM
jgi:putative nucleotidyltransferase with HDIG domain